MQIVKGQKIREIIIDKDKVQKFNKNLSVVEETYVQNGIRLYTVDSLNKVVVSFASYKDNEFNGSYFGFFIDIDMLEEKGEYKANKKDGIWYYWNRRGVLLRRELWKDGILVSKRIYQIKY